MAITGLDRAPVHDGVNREEYENQTGVIRRQRPLGYRDHPGDKESRQDRYGDSQKAVIALAERVGCALTTRPPASAAQSSRSWRK